MPHIIKFSIVEDNYFNEVSKVSKVSKIRKIIENQLDIIENEINKSDFKSVEDILDIIPFSINNKENNDYFFKYNEYVTIKLNIKRIIRSKKLNELING